MPDLHPSDQQAQPANEEAERLASDVLALCGIVDEYDKVIAAIVSGRDVTANATTEASGVGR